MTSHARLLWTCVVFLQMTSTLHKMCKPTEDNGSAVEKCPDKVKSSDDHVCDFNGQRYNKTNDIFDNNKPSPFKGCNLTVVKCGGTNETVDDDKKDVFVPKFIFNTDDILLRGPQRSLLFMCSEDEYLSYTHVCNCHIDCSNGRDEEFCPNNKPVECGYNITDSSTTCPEGFHCLGDAVAATDFQLTLTSLDIFPITTKFLNVTGLDLTAVVKPLALKHLLELHAGSCGIGDLNTIFSNNISKDLYNLDLSDNNLKILLDPGDISIFENLQFINLSFNLELTKLEYNSISSKNLKSLDMSYTSITSIDLNVFETFYHSVNYLNLENTKLKSFGFLNKILVLQQLNIKGISLQTIDVLKQIRHLTVTGSFFTDNPLLCCPHLIGPGIPEKVCHAPKDSISSCDDLLVDTSKTFLLWLVAVFSFTGNIIVLIYRICYDSVNYLKNYGILVSILSVADIFMAVYLLIISSADVHYRHSYALHDEVWRHGHLATFSFLVSNLTVCWITLDRYLMVSYSLGGNYLKTKILVVIIAVTWFVGFVLSLIPHLHQESLVHSSNSLCLSLPFTTKHLPTGGPYSISIFLVLHSVIFVCIISGQFAIFIVSTCNSTRSSNVYRSARRRRDDARIRRQLIFVATSHFISWAYIFIFSILSFFGDYEVSPNLYAWLVIVFTPLNAYCNPIIYSGAGICRRLRSTCRNRNSCRGNRHRVHLRRPSVLNQVEENEVFQLQEM